MLHHICKGFSVISLAREHRQNNILVSLVLMMISEASELSQRSEGSKTHSGVVECNVQFLFKKRANKYILESIN